LARRLPFQEIGGNDLRVLWAIHTDQRPPKIKGCPPTLETIMTSCWDKDINIRPSMEEVVSRMSYLAKFFPGSQEPIRFLYSDAEGERVGSESLVSYDTAEQSLVSQSEVAVRHKADSLSVSGDNPEWLALAVNTSSFNQPNKQPLDITAVNLNNSFGLPHLDNFNKQGYWTPPEEEVEIPQLPQYDEILLRNAPPELLRGRLNDTKAWLNDSGSVEAPSDILVEHERVGQHRPPCQEFNKMNLLDVTEHDTSYLHTFSDGSQGSEGSRRSFYGGCGYSRDYFRNLSGDYLAPVGSLSKADLSGLSSPRNLLHPSGSPASEASKSPQRSPRSKRQGVLGFRSFQNPIGSVYHKPEETEWSWAGDSGAVLGQDRAEEDRAWAGRNLLPYETLWVRPGPGEGYYVANRSPPLYTSVRSPTNLTSLAPFLPRPAPSTQLYPVPRERSQAKPTSRPYSADVGRLLSVQENSEMGPEERERSSRGHRRSSSYGTTREMAAQLRYRDTARIRPTYSYSDLHSDLHFGSRNTMLDTACELLTPDLRPVPPQPNCHQSMQIYEEHRKMAAVYLKHQSDLAEQRQYKAQLADKIKENQEIINSRTPTAEDLKQYDRLKEEKEALLAFKGKLTEQLELIKEAQLKKSGSAHSSQNSNKNGGTEGWVLVNSKPPERKINS